MFEAICFFALSSFSDSNKVWHASFIPINCVESREKIDLANFLLLSFIVNNLSFKFFALVANS